MNEHSLVHLDTAAFGDEIGAGSVLLWLFLDLTISEDMLASILLQSFNVYESLRKPLL